MNIIYISPENTVGTLSLWKRVHNELGNYCRCITFFRSPKIFDDDICLNLPFNFTQKYFTLLRHNYYKLYKGHLGTYKHKDGFPPVWAPEGHQPWYQW